MRVFSPDSLHINKKNFSSVLDFIKEKKIEYHQYSTFNHLVARYGDYEDCPVEFLDEVIWLKKIDRQSLLDIEIEGINLFQVARLELMSYLTADPELSCFGPVFDLRSIFDYAYCNKNDALIRNLAAASFYIKHWVDYLATSPKYDYALIFSGSLTYARALIEVLKKTATRVFVLESFFTGNDFYIEERFSSIPNNSYLSSRSYYESIATDPSKFLRDRAKALNKIILGSNLNVKQPEALPLDSRFLKPYVLVVGQVVNDFSLLNYCDRGISSLAVYSKLIDEILKNTAYNVVFKAHPWENRKANLRKPVTADFLRSKFESEIDGRLIVVEDLNIDRLFESAYCVILLNSQAGIEAAWNGIKPITLGAPFYGYKGFSYDFDVLRISEVVEFIDSSCKADFILDIEEYDRFENFLVKSLIYSLVSKHKSGLMALRNILAPFDHISLVSKQPAPVPKEVFQEHSPSLINEPGTQKPPIDAHARDFFERYQRYWKKYKRDPRRFFADCKNPFLRSLARFY